MRFPVAGSHRSGGPGTGFGDRGGRHQGVDIFAACGTSLVAPVDAIVARVARGPKAGNYLVLHATTTGEDHVLMHLRERATVSRGTRLHPGDPVGAVGRTGNADGCHLHYEIWTAPGWYAGGAPRDPSPDLASAAT
jgi:murein DD-endopeptidase MepM/ murein hydrolase activator NlpD